MLSYFLRLLPLNKIMAIMNIQIGKLLTLNSAERPSTTANAATKKPVINFISFPLK